MSPSVPKMDATGGFLYWLSLIWLFMSAQHLRTLSPTSSSCIEDIPLVEFMYLVFALVFVVVFVWHLTSTYKWFLEIKGDAIDDLQKFRGLHSVSACGCSTEWARFVGGTVKPRERWPDTVKRSRKGIRNAGQALFAALIVGSPVLWRCPFCAICQTNENTWNSPSLE